MMYRVSQQTVYRNIQTNLGFLTWDMARLNDQISTGKRIARPSDDPSGTAAVMAMRTVLADTEQYYKDVALADDWLKQSESVLQNMKLVVERATVLCEQMSTDTYINENMDVAADEVDELFEGLIKLGNTRFGDRYIFAGRKTEVRPFESELFIHDPLSVSGNSSSYWGEVKTVPEITRSYQSLPGYPDQTKVFMVEITSAGGVGGDSRAAAVVDDPAVQHDALIFQARSAHAGASGNGIYVDYVLGNSAGTTVAVAGSHITVNLETNSAGTESIAAADDILAAVQGNSSASALVSVRFAPGNSGNGTAGPTTSALSAANSSGEIYLTGGISGAAAFRVSEDGGRTWGPADWAAVQDTETSIWNELMGRSTLVTNLPGGGNDIQFTSNLPGRAGDEIKIEYVKGAALAVTEDIASHTVTVTVSGTNTAWDVVSAVNAASYFVQADIADYRQGGGGSVGEMNLLSMSGGVNEISHLGQASLTIDPDGPENGLVFTADPDYLPGSAGNNLEISYVMGSSSTWADVSAGSGFITVYLETDASGDSVATAFDVRSAVTNAPPPLVRVSLADYAEGEGGKIRDEIGPLKLSGGDDSITGDQNVKLLFTDDGTPLQVGDRFELELSYYRGDDQGIDVNSNQGTRVQINVTGEEALGAAGARDNILDTLARLSHALRKHDTKEVADELPRLDEGLRKLATNMAMAGVRLTRNQFTVNVLQSQEDFSTERMSRVEDMDLAEAVTDLQTKQTAYQASLASTSLVTRLSLVDYIR